MESEDVSAKCEGMQQAFCVMTYEETLDPKTGEMPGRFLNHRVLKGNQEKIDEMKALLEENVKGDFEIRLREEKL